MAIRTRRFWLYALCALGMILAAAGGAFAGVYHAGIEVRDSFVVLDTDLLSASLQWTHGISLWVWSPDFETRIWPQE